MAVTVNRITPVPQPPRNITGINITSVGGYGCATVHQDADGFFVLYVSREGATTNYRLVLDAEDVQQLGSALIELATQRW